MKKATLAVLAAALMALVACNGQQLQAEAPQTPSPEDRITMLEAQVRDQQIAIDERDREIEAKDAMFDALSGQGAAPEASGEGTKDAPPPEKPAAKPKPREEKRRPKYATLFNASLLGRDQEEPSSTVGYTNMSEMLPCNGRCITIMNTTDMPVVVYIDDRFTTVGSGGRVSQRKTLYPNSDGVLVPADISVIPPGKTAKFRMVEETMHDVTVVSYTSRDGVTYMPSRSWTERLGPFPTGTPNGAWMRATYGSLHKRVEPGETR